MKKIIVSLSLLLSAGLTQAFAAPEPDQKVLDGFKLEFPAAEQVSWSTQEEYEKAIFVMAGRRVVAFFSREGILEGSMCNIFFDQLPLMVMTAVQKRFNDAIIVDVREVSNSEGTSYRLRLEKNNRKYNIKVSPDGNITDVKKTK